MQNLALYKRIKEVPSPKKRKLKNKSGKSVDTSVS